MFKKDYALYTTQIEIVLPLPCDTHKIQVVNVKKRNAYNAFFASLFYAELFERAREGDQVAFTKEIHRCEFHHAVTKTFPCLNQS